MIELEAGIDYTGMSVPNSAEGIMDWLERCRGARKMLEDAGNVTKPLKLLSYEGTMTGSLFWGSRELDWYIRCSSAWADKLFSQMYSPMGSFSRIDLQVTVRFERKRNEIGPAAYKMLAAAAKRETGKNRRQVRRMDNNDGGYSVYVGSRNSASYCNIYDKDAESGEEYYKNCWRFEVRYRDEAANSIAHQLFARNGNRRQTVASTVWQWLHARGYTAPWSKSDETSVLVPRMAPQTDVERKLTWLRTQVRPTIELLAKLGYTSNSLEALGLTNVLGSAESEVEG